MHQSVQRTDTFQSAARKNVTSTVSDNSHTSKRLKHKLMNRFQKFGGATARPVAGYLVPPGAKTYDDWSTEPDATPVLREGLRRLRESPNGQAVADYFNAVPYRGGAGFPPGPYCRRRRWDGRMVLRLYRNTVLSGRPGRGYRRTVKRHEDGRRISLPNPDGPAFRSQPNLAHLDPGEHDAVVALLAASNASCRRKGRGEGDPRLAVTDPRRPVTALAPACSLPSPSVPSLKGASPLKDRSALS